MKAIVVDQLSKEYKVHERPPGLRAALKSVFSRTYKTVHAVSELSFSIEQGERVGFLGPNGAGKTTTLKMLSGLLHPTSGTARVAGHTPHLREADFLRRITLVMGQKQQLLWDLPPADTFAYNGALFDVPKAELDATLAELETLLDLSEVKKKPTRQLSLGERMKCELAAALLHKPSVLFLDEPTIGLDVSMQLAVREFIRAYNERTGATVILTSHYMDDVASLCKRVIVVDEGKLRYDGDLSALVRDVMPDKRVSVRLSSPSTREELEKVGAVIELEPGRAVLSVKQATLRDAIAHLLAHAAVTDLTVEDPPLEEAMRALFTKTASVPE
jgi:ABC-2 type transport system ATP-binding protein